MDSPTSMLLFGLMLSVVQLSLGIALGCWFMRRPPADGERPNLRAKENQRAATRLLEWTREVADNVHNHSGKIDDVEAQLTQFEENDDVAEAIVARADSALYASKFVRRNSGHLHNGRACVPIRAASDTTGQRDMVAEAADTLRQRVHELVAPPE